MGYAHYMLADGREAGYAVDDICNKEGCTVEIDRGLSYLCGATPGGDEYGCGKYFCEEHLYADLTAEHESTISQCDNCRAAWEKEHPHAFPEESLNGTTHRWTIECRRGAWNATGTDILDLERRHSEHEHTAA